MQKSNVTVFLEVFNEEARIESCLKNFSWAEELIVFDKHSTDRTREIAEKYATKVITVPFTQASENIVNNYSN
ncbi:MAG: glycosyltransferase, partial [Methylobacter sp.]